MTGLSAFGKLKMSVYVTLVNSWAHKVTGFVAQSGKNVFTFCFYGFVRYIGHSHRGKKSPSKKCTESNSQKLTSDKMS